MAPSSAIRDLMCVGREETNEVGQRDGRSSATITRRVRVCKESTFALVLLDSDSPLPPVRQMGKQDSRSDREEEESKGDRARIRPSGVVGYGSALFDWSVAADREPAGEESTFQLAGGLGPGGGRRDSLNLLPPASVLGAAG